ncbi:MAG TPA: DUF3501 family protein [Ideonella sp.]|uniref:DUF3501 family protein n=1 Tax=Ideonella sp. TaxID=1929293 RepID=UPI002CA29AEB|nr:DUF3501 family protein [Ideonella sp.]HSI48486.1 DUF3501 family protein [Ideonella sp.]
MIPHPKPLPPAGDALATLQAWWSHRREHQRQLQAHRRARTVALGPHWQLQFEDELTVRSRLLEAFHGQAAAPAGSDWTAHVPDGTEWTATLTQTVLPEQAGGQPLALLHALLDQAATRLYVEVERQPRVWVQAVYLGGEKASAPRHALRFALTESFRAAVLAGRPAMLGCAHPHADWSRPIPAYAMQRLRRELALPGRSVASPAWPGRGFATAG